MNIKDKKSLEVIVDDLDELHCIMSQVYMLPDLTQEQYHNNIGLFKDQLGVIMDSIYKLVDKD